MKRRCAALPLLLLLACRRDASHGSGDHDHGQHAAARPALSFTHWTEAAELFVELPVPVQGLPSPLAAHVTRLRDGSPLEAGTVTALLRDGGAEERAAASAPSAPGIFRPVIRPSRAGAARLLVEIAAEGLRSVHDLGEVTVFPSEQAARAAVKDEGPPAGRITFLKEQQWPLRLRTAPIEERALRATLRAAGAVVARSDGEAVVAAPMAGRLVTVGGAFPRIGRRVAVDEPLAVLVPRVETADQAQLELAVRSADIELRFAEREHERLTALRDQGVVPERRAQDAAHAFEEARASVEAARRRLEQFQRAQGAPGGRAPGSLTLRAPLHGTLVAVPARPGSFIEAGAALFRVVDTSSLWLEARVPAADAARLGAVRGAWFELEGFADPFELGPEALVARGAAIDPAARTVPVIFALDNPGGRLHVGAFARVHLVVGEEPRALAVPRAAIVDDGGVSVVYVEVEGESFERRPVEVGPRDGDLVAVQGALKAGERAVTQAAYAVKLAASASTVPAHGHSH